MLMEPKLDFDDVLIVPKISELTSRSEVNLTSKKLQKLLKIDTCGIIAANMDGVGTFEVAKVLRTYGVMTALVKHYSLDELVAHFESEESSHSWYTLGKSTQDFEKLTQFINIDTYDKSRPLKIQIDVPNGYMTDFPDYINNVRKLIPNSIIMVGNVAEFEGFRTLSNANIVCLGIGPGSNCLTRTQTGIGYPQFSAVYDTALMRRRHNLFNPLICSDGGCSSPGDIAKAFGAGADMVMLGGMLAGTKEGKGDFTIDENDNIYVYFYGMSSKTAQLKHSGELKTYRSSEGRTTKIPFKGKMADVIENILGGIRSTCTYTNCANIDDLKNGVEFIRVNNTLNRSMEKYTIGN